MTDVDPAARAFVAAAVADRDVAEFAIGLIAAGPADQTTDARIRAARRLRLLALEVLDRTVIAEALAGASWEELGAALGLDPAVAEGRYAQAVELWQDPAGAWMRGPGEAGDPDVAGTAAAVDAWFARVQPLLNPGAEAEESPVSRLLTDQQ
ncbi:hypothetical protein [Kitasatospora sp. NPDC088548]|uniref:hypothetical protein n=1 Tax=Kitasatospora sp. NPDC088548 TaxID=3364075 RepID=UPI00380526E6